MKEQYYLVNLYDGDVQAVFDSSDDLIAYLKRMDEDGGLMGEAAFTVFLGRHLATHPYWIKAFGE